MKFSQLSIRNQQGKVSRRLAAVLAVLFIIIAVAAVPNWSKLRPLEDGAVADRILVEKSKRTLTLLSDGKVLKSYKIALGGQPAGHKQFEGDQKTPEGDYVIDWRNENSKFHRSLHISYPNATDLEYAQSQGKSAGGDIFIHGSNPDGLWCLLSFYEPPDWTLGCIGLTNAEIEELWRAVPNGTPIEIRP